MNERHRILHVAADPASAERLRELLREAGLDAEVEAVHSLEGLRLGLERAALMVAWLAPVPGLDPRAGRELVRATRPESVFVQIGGSAPEETEVAIARLALREAEQRRLREQAEQALHDADRQRTEFLAMLSHELRNPLAPIRNSIFVLERADPRGDQAARARAVIDRQVRQLSRLVDDLLDVTRISRGRARLQPETLELGALVRRTAEDHRSVFDRGGIELQVTTAGEPVELSADPARLVQMIGNLLQNAAKFTPRGGHAEVRVERRPDSAVIRVRDDGVGIVPEMMGRLFEPFAQSDHTLDRSRGGLGLGLALVSGLAELHGGRVSADSPGPGGGAEFVIELPLRTQAPTQAARPEPPRQRPSRRVLVIEDNVDAAESLREALQLGAHVVEVAYSGTEGLQKARGFRPDLVLCDIGLPGMSGYEVARALRADPELRATEVVALSGYAIPQERIREAGFGAYLSKPPDMESLERLIAETDPERGRRF